MKIRPNLFLFFLLFLTSCGRTNKLSEKDYSWMPYKGNETLVFKSNTGDTDTIFLLKKYTLMAYPEPQSLFGIKYEIVCISCRFSDPYSSDGAHRYLEGRFLEIGKAMDRHAELNILLSAKDAQFYRLSRIKIDSLSRVSPVTIETSSGQYNDIYVIDSEDYLGTFRKRNNFITKLYWSRSSGVIRYDKRNNVYWELLKIEN